MFSDWIWMWNKSLREKNLIYQKAKKLLHSFFATKKYPTKKKLCNKKLSHSIKLTKSTSLMTLNLFECKPKSWELPMNAIAIILLRVNGSRLWTYALSSAVGNAWKISVRRVSLQLERYFLCSHFMQFEVDTKCA